MSSFYQINVTLERQVLISKNAQKTNISTVISMDYLIWLMNFRQPGINLRKTRKNKTNTGLEKIRVTYGYNMGIMGNIISIKP